MKKSPNDLIEREAAIFKEKKERVTQRDKPSYDWEMKLLWCKNKVVTACITKLQYNNH